MPSFCFVVSWDTIRFPVWSSRDPQQWLTVKEFSDDVRRFNLRSAVLLNITIRFASLDKVLTKMLSGLSFINIVILFHMCQKYPLYSTAFWTCVFNFVSIVNFNFYFGFGYKGCGMTLQLTQGCMPSFCFVVSCDTICFPVWLSRNHSQWLTVKEFQFAKVLFCLIIA